ncbi:MAG TPA: hypothetical protein VGP24_05990 [Glaciihabitans sp.]|jgi:hypothetical protein|nr:hypothetical protein [Glaciihabitans sp.]
MSIGALRPSVAPQSVLPTAAKAAAELANVEASDLAVVAGAPRLTVRFTADDTELAQQIAGHTVATVRDYAEVTGWIVTVRAGARWNRIE